MKCAVVRVGSGHDESFLRELSRVGSVRPSGTTEEKVREMKETSDVPRGVRLARPVAPRPRLAFPLTDVFSVSLSCRD